MAKPHSNEGYERHATLKLHSDGGDHTWGDYFDVGWDAEMNVMISPDLKTLTITVKWNWIFLDSKLTGSGFIDYIGVAWYDEKYRPEFDPQWFLNYDHPVPPYYDVHLGGPGENWEIVEDELGQVANRTGSDFWDVLTFSYCWQRNDGAGINGQKQFDERCTHSWQLTDDDWDDNGQLRDRLVFYVYERHRDNGGDLYLGPPHKEENAHWLITHRYPLVFDMFNWKYHPFAIRIGGEWYSCNRLDEEVGHGNGHSAIRKGGRWNGLWNDDFHGNLDAEAFYDDEPEGKGEYTFLPRVGTGRNAQRSTEQVHEWES